MLNNKLIIVGMADLNTCRDKGGLTTLGLGSCVGIALYDPVSKVAGLAHCMLPDSKQIQNNENKAKFVDTACAKILGDMMRMGARSDRIRAKLAGGAQMFGFTSTNEAMRIGDKNIKAAIEAMKYYNIPILARDVGETYGRTVELYAEDGRFVIKTIGHGTKTI